MQEEDLHLKLRKCAFDQTTVEYLETTQVGKSGSIVHCVL